MNMGSGYDFSDSYLGLLKESDGIQYDVTFVVGSTKEKICCHKLILSARSPVFKTMFADRWASGDEIELPDVEPQVFQLFLENVYAGKAAKKVFVDDDISFIEMLIYLAEKYSVSDLKFKFVEMLIPKLRVENVLQIYAIAEKYSVGFLRMQALWFATSHFAELIMDPSFESMSKDVLHTCVVDRRERKEIDVFKGLIKWAEARCEESGTQIDGANIRKVLEGILPDVRFSRMTIEEFRNFVVTREILTPVELLDVYDHLARDTSGRSEHRTGMFSSASTLTQDQCLSNRPAWCCCCELSDSSIHDGMENVI